MKKQIATKSHNQLVIKWLLLLVLLYVLWVFVRSISQSLIFNKPDRLNIAFVTQKPTFISIGYGDRVDYKAQFDSHLSVKVPGGYGQYALFAVAKLAEIEKKEDIVRRTFSSLTSTNIDFYFIDTSQKSSIISYSLFDVLTNKYKTNASLIDRIILYFDLHNTHENDISELDTHIQVNSDQSYEDAFYEKYQGFFYKKILRAEDKTIQIIYSESSSAHTLSHILDGEGVHVVDLTQRDSPESRCVFTKSAVEKTKTEEYFITHFGCIIKKGDTAGQDFKVELGKEAESVWE